MRTRSAGWTWGVLGATLIACGGDELRGKPPTGGVDGYVCDPNTNRLAAGATIEGKSPSGTLLATADDNGFFALEGLEIGDQMLDVAGVGVSFSATIEVRVVEGEVTRLPDPPCLTPRTGVIEGRICASEAGIGSGQGYWLAGATVSIVIGTDTYETTTDATGNFRLEGVPQGEHTLRVEKGSFSSTSSVTVGADETTTLEHLCVAPSVRMAVFTGAFDSVQDVLGGLGFLAENCRAGGGSSFCDGQTLTPGGNVTLIEADDPVRPYFVEDILCSTFELSQYDILFFNCGLRDEYIWGGAPCDLPGNLQEFALNGGSIYASDWAYEVLRIGFPGQLSYFGGDSAQHLARAGDLNPTLDATIEDPTLAAVVGTSSVTLNYNKASWTVLEVSQPTGVTRWVTGDPSVDSSQTLIGAPLLVSFEVGAGRIVFTTFHTHQQASVAMTDILRYIVFEL